MKSTYVILLVAVVSIGSAQLEEQKCKANESFTTCGTACEPSCDKPLPTFCTLQCIIGCQCNQGFLRNSKGDCMKPEDCKTTPTKCPANETFTQCHNFCTEKKCPMKNAPMISCLQACQIGCGCSKGFVRNNRGQCVKESDCPRIDFDSTPDSTHDDSSNSDENPCNLVDCKLGFVCELRTGEPKCVPVKRSLTCATMLCRNGFVCKDVEGRGRCVPAEESTPGITCSNVRCGTPGGCAMVLPSGCEPGKCAAQPECVQSNPCAATSCLVGSDCVLRKVQCFTTPCDPIPECYTPPKDDKCGQNEVTVPCKNECSEFKCGQTEEKACTRDCKGPGCACRKGFFRNTSGKCVTENECLGGR